VAITERFRHVVICQCVAGLVMQPPRGRVMVVSFDRRTHKPIGFSLSIR